jgi:hypothetical protein
MDQGIQYRARESGLVHYRSGHIVGTDWFRIAHQQPRILDEYDASFIGQLVAGRTLEYEFAQIVQSEERTVMRFFRNTTALALFALVCRSA